MITPILFVVILSKVYCLLSSPSSRFFTLSSIEVTIESIKLNSSAHQNPSTRKSSTSFAASNIISALITNKKRPSVKKVIGIVKMIMIGLTTAFKKASTAATINAVKKLLSTISTPGNK